MTPKIPDTRTQRKRDEKRLDDLFSQFVRRRAIKRAGGCEKCLRPKTDIQKENGDIFPAWKQLQCSHYEGRSSKVVRFDESNAAGLCGNCHIYLEHHPHEHTEWFKEYLGEREFDLLTARARNRERPDIGLLMIYYTEKIKNEDY